MQFEANVVDVTGVYEELKATSARPGDVPVVAGPGVYALFAREADCLLPEIVLAGDGLLYMGKSGNLRQRNHFAAEHSGFSSLRRSLGAILKTRLGLTAIPRAPGSSETNVRNFRFAGDGERQLSAWMRQYLEYAVFAFHGELQPLEAKIIKAYRPPLNLTGWPNPLEKVIRRLRSECRAEAKKLREEAGYPPLP